MLRSELQMAFFVKFSGLPIREQKKTTAALKLWERDNSHPGLQFKKLKTKADNIYSIRINDKPPGTRAVGEKKGDAVEWLWVGPHDEYMRLLKRL